MNRTSCAHEHLYIFPGIVDSMSPILLVMISLVYANYDNNGTRITEIPRDISINKTLVNLSENAIVIIRFGDLQNLQAVLELNLYDNNISIIEEGAFDSMDSLGVLKLGKNNIASIPNITSLADTLKELSLTHNKITVLEPRTLEGFYVLEIIELDENKISGHLKLPVLPRLEELNFASNAIESLEPGLFEGYDLLRKVKFHENRIRVIPYLGDASAHITFLQLRRNCIDVFPNLGNFTSLETINLKRNNLTNIPRDAISNIGPATIRIEQNPIVCNEDLCWALEESWPFTLNFTCTDGTQWKNININVLCYSKLI